MIIIPGDVPVTVPFDDGTFLGSKAGYDVVEFIVEQFVYMLEWLLDNKLFLIGLVIFVIGACIGLVKRIRG